MVDLSIKKVEEMMKNQLNIRNISVIAHVDHGKSTLTDTLVIKAKIASQESGGGRYMDTRADEQERGITIKSTAISMHFELPESVLKGHLNQKHNGNEFLINLIDSPGHVDFSSEVTAALRVTDGAIVVVDCVDGICVQTETVLRQAVAEKIRPTVCLNKVDRALLELQESKAQLYARFRRRVEDFNAKLQMITLGKEDSRFPIHNLQPELNEFSFCSGLQGWGFTLRQFASFYAERFNVKDKPEGEKRICKMLWANDVFYTAEDPFDTTGTFKKQGSPEKAPFIVFILNPIYTVRDYCMAVQHENLRNFLTKYNVTLPTDLPNEPKTLFKLVMRTWLPAADTMLEQIILQLPSPVLSQSYRYDSLYEGPVDDIVALGIKNAAVDSFKCSDQMSSEMMQKLNIKVDANNNAVDANNNPIDANNYMVDVNNNVVSAPLAVYISKMVPYSDNRFIAFGRVFSGKVTPGMKVRVQGPDYVPGSKNDLFIANIQRTVVMMGRTVKDVSMCPAGNIIGLIGIDDKLKKTGTITNTDVAHNIKGMKFSVSPVVKYSVSPLNPVDLPKLKAGLAKLSKSDPLSVVNFSDNGELTIAGAGELHLEVCLKDLEEDYAGVKIVYGEPCVSYLEGIRNSVLEPKMCKSSNKHNRIYMTCSSLDPAVVENLENGKLVVRDPKERVAAFNSVLGIRDDWIKKIMFYGPEDKGPNLFVDATKGIAYLNEVKEYLREGFRDVTSKGPLIEEKLRGVRFELTDMVLHSDAIHRTGNQITMPVSEVCRGLIMAATPVLYEPIFRIEVNVATEAMSEVIALLATRRGDAEEVKEDGSSRTNIYGILPVKESFGFNAALMKVTRGQASSSLCFSHYEVMPGNLAMEGSLMHEVVTTIRNKKRFGKLKSADEYFDRL
ncbi:elongation factor 2 [Hamiltosporidium tvaerminnensis]|uniref:Elongation factor 2 n=1 Tax=Hamiltosporidium tvaerminnensis TaxID=1176355 RepID=A0A4Q9M139_9MICR|nr:elongation factor 2 [Hamiltosporidium tvaerminnensis]